MVSTVDLKSGSVRPDLRTNASHIPTESFWLKRPEHAGYHTADGREYVSLSRQSGTLSPHPELPVGTADLPQIKAHNAGHHPNAYPEAQSQHGFCSPIAELAGSDQP